MRVLATTCRALRSSRLTAETKIRGRGVNCPSRLTNQREAYKHRPLTRRAGHGEAGKPNRGNSLPHRHGNATAVTGTLGYLQRETIRVLAISTRRIHCHTCDNEFQSGSRSASSKARNRHSGSIEKHRLRYAFADSTSDRSPPPADLYLRTFIRNLL
jgi:hypothetical protein